MSKILDRPYANLDNVPSEMKLQRRFVCWKYEPRPNDPTKLQKTPYMPFALDRKASTQNPKHWSTFKQASYQFNKGLCNGIGFVLGEGYVLVDLDHCIIDGKLTQQARDIIKLLDSYTERSPSGNGVHIFVKTNLEIGNRRTEGLEIYSKDRYSTLTGDCKNPKLIAYRDKELQQLMDMYLPAKPEAPKAKRESKQIAPTIIYGPITHIPDSDKQLWERMFNSRQGERYRHLFQGTYKVTDPSLADKLLLNGLAFWTGYDSDRMRRMALQTGLYRERWNELRNGAPMLDHQIAESIAFASNATGVRPN